MGFLKFATNCTQLPDSVLAAAIGAIGADAETDAKVSISDVAR